MSKALNKLGVPSAKDIEVLSARIDELNRNISKLDAKAGAARRSARQAARQACCQAYFAPQVGLRPELFACRALRRPFCVRSRCALLQCSTDCNRGPTLTS